MMPGPMELILILVILIVVFGAKKIPEIMGGLGEGIRSFKKSMEGEDTSPKPPAQPQPPQKSDTPSTPASASSGESPKSIEPK